MSIYKTNKLSFAKALLEQHQLKLEDQLSYYENQHEAEKGRNSMIDFNKAINEIFEDLNQVQKEIHFINKLETNLEIDESEEILNG
jgi:hypothetical protein